MLEKPKIFVLIAAAGSGHRFGSDIPKQYQSLAGKTVLRHSIEKFLPFTSPDHIRVIIDADHINLYQNSVIGLGLAPHVTGGSNRKTSIFNGLKSLDNVKNEDIIIIHDAARPLVNASDIENLIVRTCSCHAATLVGNIKDTLINLNDNSTPNRDCMKAIQTPQAFSYKTILGAHNNFKDQDNFTDDSSLVIANGDNVEYIESTGVNFKITTKDDFHMAELLLNNARTIRTGMGFDVHAFDEKPSETIRLGGIDIPHPMKLKGHSDADVALHTITDALLGAIAAGDIGDHFPPSDMTFKNMDSAVFLKKAAEIIREKNAEIINIDLTIICEEPKIGLHKETMRLRIAEILDIPIEKISVKATTTERLGFTGRKEGIAAQAVVNVEVPR